MSRDGYLPDDVTEDMVPGNRPGDNHDESCPCHEDQPETCICGCDMEGHPEDHCESELGLSGKCGCDGRRLAEPECICGNIEEERKEAIAEARAEARKEAKECDI